MSGYLRGRPLFISTPPEKQNSTFFSALKSHLKNQSVGQTPQGLSFEASLHWNGAIWKLKLPPEWELPSLCIPVPNRHHRRRQIKNRKKKKSPLE